MRKYFALKQNIWVVVVLICLQYGFTESANSQVNDPWCTILQRSGNNYWRVRLPIEIENISMDSLMGSHVQIQLSAANTTSVLLGEEVGNIRVTDSNGDELLFDCKTEQGDIKHKGIIEAGDILTLPVTVPGRSKDRFYIYSGNPDAWPIPYMGDFKWFSGSVRNLWSWLDDHGDPEPANSKVKVNLLQVERLELRSEGADAPWIEGAQWTYRVPISIRNFEETAPGDINRRTSYFLTDTRKIYNNIVKLFGCDPEYALKLVDPTDSEREKIITGDLREWIVSEVYLPPRSEKVYWLYISSDPNAVGQSTMASRLFGGRDQGWAKTDSRIGKIEARNTQEKPLVAWPINPMVKVFPDDLPAENAEKELKIYGSLNSTRTAQVIVRSTNEGKVSVRVSGLKGPEGEVLPGPAIFRAGFVPADHPVRYSRPSGTVSYHHRKILDIYRRTLTAKNQTLLGPQSQPTIILETDSWSYEYYPDPLIPVNPDAGFNLKAKTAQPVYFDVEIPADAMPGIYRGELLVTNKNETLNIPIEVKVWKSVLPDKPSLPALIEADMNIGHWGKKLGGCSDEAFVRTLASYNLSASYIFETPEFSYNRNGKLVMKTDKFDRMAKLQIEELHTNMLFAPIDGYGPSCEGYKKEDTEEAYRLFIEHITEKGWRKNFVYFVYDEPGNQNPPREHWDEIVRRADMVRKVAADVPVYSSPWHYYPVLEDHINIWGIGSNGSFPDYKIDELRKKGNRFWFTTDGQLTINTPYLAIERLLPWFAFNYNVDGYEYWHATRWTINPWKFVGPHWASRKLITEHKRQPNGDGYLFYPGDEIGLNEPVASIRAMAAREGLDDYEIFIQLKVFAEEGNQEAKQALDLIRKLATIPNKSGGYSSHIMKNPDTYQEAVIQAGEILDHLIQK